MQYKMWVEAVLDIYFHLYLDVNMYLKYVSIYKQTSAILEPHIHTYNPKQ